MTTLIVDEPTVTDVPLRKKVNKVESTSDDFEEEKKTYSSGSEDSPASEKVPAIPVVEHVSFAQDVSKLTANFLKNLEITEQQAFAFLSTIPEKRKKRKKKTTKSGKTEKQPTKKRRRAAKPASSKSKPAEKPINLKLLKKLQMEEWIAKAENLPPGKKRAGFDLFESSKDVPLNEIGTDGGGFVKQKNGNSEYKDWNEAYKNQVQEFKWEIWLDPSAPSIIVHPAHLRHGKKPSHVVHTSEPHNVDLAQEFGPGIEFVYISPPWKTSNNGNGAVGYFDLEHLRALDLSKVQTRGFVFIWVRFDKMIELLKIFEEKNYTYSDSTCAFCTNWEGAIDVRQRNSTGNYADSNDPIEKALSKMAGTKFHGVLFKKNTPASAGRFRIGNQIIVDCFPTRIKTDPESGQYKVDHGYVFQMYEYLIVNKVLNKKKNQAIHLFCSPTFSLKGWGGVHYQR